jgi:hypothetical protein
MIYVYVELFGMPTTKREKLRRSKVTNREKAMAC